MVILKKKRKTRIPAVLKALVWNTYVGEDIGSTLCPVCNKHKITQLTFHCGHVISEAKGGQCKLDNMRPICIKCNLSMRTMHMYDFKHTYFGNDQTITPSCDIPILE